MKLKKVTSQERELSNRIYELRIRGNLEDAIQICDEAIEIYRSSNFFFKIKGDILYDLGNYEDAISAYMNFLKRIKDKPELFTKFATFFQKAVGHIAVGRNTYETLARMIGEEEYPYIIRKGLLILLLQFYQVPEELSVKIDECVRAYTAEKIKSEYENVTQIGKCETIIFLCGLEKEDYARKDNSANLFVLKRLEMEKLYEPAIKLVKKMLAYSEDVVYVRALFRICRVRDDYTEAKELMRQKDIVHEKEFNVQYELVYFFEAEGDEEARNQALAYIDKLSVNKIPICRALFKFYIRYDMLKEAKDLQDRIAIYSQELSVKNKRQKQEADLAEKETQEVIWERLQTLVSEQEHNRQLQAMAELIKGFSHELGQPITNIRYAIQLFHRKNRKLRRENGAEEEQLLQGILRQTERAGKLLERFAPLTSSRSQKEFFSAMKVIRGVFEEMSLRLSNEEIECQVIGDEKEEIYGEALQFTQVFYNLIINAIHAIRKKGIKGKICVEQHVNGGVLMIKFSDNGMGIQPELRRKIFEPFFSTKNEDGEEDGGEGLGLFIVWNILKMLNGRIYVEPSYKNGACFVIEIIREEEGYVSNIVSGR